MSKQGLYSLFSSCNKEEELKSEFCKFFHVKLNAIKGIDHYSSNILFEFKYDRNFRVRNNIASVLAQTMYYVRWLKFGNSKLRIPPYICVIDKNEAFFVETKKFNKIYSSNNSKYDWDRSPSTPCPNLVAKLESLKEIDSIKIFDLTQEIEESTFVNWCRDYLFGQISFLDLLDKKTISEENFWEVFEYWDSKFGKYVKNGRKSSEYFLADIEVNRSIKRENGEILFDLGDKLIKKNVQPKEYENFWKIYDKVSSKDITVIRQKSDRITEDFRRRFNGEFYTPIEFAEKGLEYLEREIGEGWWKSGEYRFWDMAAGTGNLEFNLPSSALKYCYISTIEEDEAKYCQKIFPAATCFCYDYLNDDTLYVDGLFKLAYQKLPQNLKNDLANPQIKWIIFINPPFKTANVAEKKMGKKSMDSVSMTALQKAMSEDNYGEASRELYIQFLYRISLEFKEKDVHLCMYSTLKYLNSNNDQKIRDGFFQYKFCRGFMFPISCFFGPKGKFPVGFLIWNLAKKQHLQKQVIKLDVFNKDVEKEGTKIVPSVSRDNMLNKWCPRLPWDGESVMPMFSGAFSQQTNNKDQRDRVAKGFLFSMASPGDDMQHQNNVFILSAPYANAGAFSVTSENFEKAMILFAVKWLPKAVWSNNRDAFYAPNVNLSRDFINDCVIYSAFHFQNLTTSLKNIKHKGLKYNIINNLFPFAIREINKWKIANKDFSSEISSQNEDRFLAEWLKSQTLSTKAQAVLDAARNLYKRFYANMYETNWIDYHVESWDVGLCQIIRSLKNTGIADDEIEALEYAEQRLHDKLLPKVYEFGFLNPDVAYFHNCKSL